MEGPSRAARVLGLDHKRSGFCPVHYAALVTPSPSRRQFRERARSQKEKTEGGTAGLKRPSCREKVVADSAGQGNAYQIREAAAWTAAEQAI